MATNYQRGRAFEYRTRDKLIQRGAVYVMRAAQSKGAADLIALWPLERFEVDGADPPSHYFEIAPPWLVQCKRGVGRISPAERVVLKELAAVTGAIPVQALPGKNGRGVVFTNLNSMEEI